MACKHTKNFTFEAMNGWIIWCLQVIVLLTNPFCTLAQQAQNKAVFEPKQGFLIDMSYGIHRPAADMALRFGPNSSLGLGVNYKTKGNWIFGLNYQWLFGQNVWETNMLDSIAGPDGHILDELGTIAVIRFFERGHTGYAQAAKLIPVTKRNRNSGIYLQAGAGLMIHRVYIFSSTTTVPQLSDEMKKGYDRMAAGFSLKQFIGYQHLDPVKRVNVLAGIEFQEGFTNPMRSYDYDLRKAETGRRMDILIAPKIGLIIPIYTKKRSDEEFFTD